MSAKHTPGPWAIDGCVSLGNVDVIYGSGRITMMECENDEINDDELFANAALIAAAPEMLAALKCIADALSPPRNAEEAAAIAAALAAIAKAEAVA